MGISCGAAAACNGPSVVGWPGQGSIAVRSGVVSDIPKARLVEMERRANIRRGADRHGGLTWSNPAIEHGGKHGSGPICEDATKIYAEVLLI